MLFRQEAWIYYIPSSVAFWNWLTSSCKFKKNTNSAPTIMLLRFPQVKKKKDYWKDLKILKPRCSMFSSTFFLSLIICKHFLTYSIQQQHSSLLQFSIPKSEETNSDANYQFNYRIEKWRRIVSCMRGAEWVKEIYTARNDEERRRIESRNQAMLRENSFCSVLHIKWHKHEQLIIVACLS